MDTTQLTFLGYGFGLGLVVVLWVAISGWRRRRNVEAELLRLRQHLHDHMEITQAGVLERKQELERLRVENENLRVTLKAWQQKPDRKELRMLQVYDHAVRELLVRAPGFSPYWENALRDADVAVAQIDSGVVAFARRLLLPFSGRRREPPPEE
jgi:hypothetical protein